MNNNNDGLEILKQSIYEFGKAVKKALPIHIEESLLKSFSVIANGLNNLGKWYKAIEILVNNQYVFCDPISWGFIDLIMNSDDVNKEVEGYYSEDDYRRFYKLTDRCRESLKDNNNYELFNQSIKACENSSYQLACLGLFAITDGLLSAVSNQMNPNYIRRLNTIKEKFDQSVAFEPVEVQILSISIALEKIDVSIFANSDFHSDEPECINRHWTLHGRSKREYLFTDVIKVLLWIDALLFIQNYDNEEDNRKEQ